MLDTSFTNGIAWQGLSSSSTIDEDDSQDHHDSHFPLK
jgi:hypothetical protein